MTWEDGREWNKEDEDDDGAVDARRAARHGGVATGRGEEMWVGADAMGCKAREGRRDGAVCIQVEVC